MINNITLTTGQILYILTAQYNLNMAFSGEEWKTDPVYPSGLNASADAELGEFLNEIKKEWKLHGKPVNGNRDDAMFELVDVVHFMAAAMNCMFIRGGICEKDYAKMLESISDFQHYIEYDVNVMIKDTPFYEQFSRAYREFWSMLDYINTSRNGLGNTLTDKNICYILQKFRETVACGITKMGFSSEELLNAFMMKEARNYARIRGGILEGVDVKTSEERLCL